MKISFSSKFIQTSLSAALAVLMLGLGLHFFFSEGVQLVQIRDAISQSDRRWLYLGIGLSVAYIWLHSEMYRQGFRALGLNVSMGGMMRMYLKRNLVSVFLPAGFISSQAFFSGEIARSEKVHERDVLSASGIFSVAALPCFPA